MKARSKLTWPAERTLSMLEYMHGELFRQLTSLFGRKRAGETLMGRCSGAEIERRKGHR